ncbi:TetR/AcrR family transcriptional regulator [Acidocella sp.]|uniref:TetR/AcrR family transcriptional regulator n=1 Tax=Acidocella sp. TaxID=50710 RepID=UPI002612E688|nr:TetR/AcrR family transcriptional regulator [Acidocella sp.]
MSEQMRKRGHKGEQASRLTALIEAAEAVFLQKGYHAATMNDVAKAAGMSKKTVYELVESKIDLFFSILADHHEKIVFPSPEPGWSAADMLSANLLCLGRFLLAPVQIALIRLIMAEYTHSPDFGREFLRNRVARAKARLEDTLSSLACPALSAAQAKEMSALLFGMALGEFHIAALIGFRPPPSRQALEARVRRAVEIFLAGCAPAKPGITPPSATCGAPRPGA